MCGSIRNEGKKSYRPSPPCNNCCQMENRGTSSQLVVLNSGKVSGYMSNNTQRPAKLSFTFSNNNNWLDPQQQITHIVILVVCGFNAFYQLRFFLHLVQSSLWIKQLPLRRRQSHITLTCHRILYRQISIITQYVLYQRGFAHLPSSREHQYAPQLFILDRIDQTYYLPAFTHMPFHIYTPQK